MLPTSAYPMNMGSGLTKKPTMTCLQPKGFWSTGPLVESSAIAPPVADEVYDHGGAKKHQMILAVADVHPIGVGP